MAPLLHRAAITTIRASASAVDETSHTADGHEDSDYATVDNLFDFSDQTAEQSNEHQEFLNDKDRDLSMLNRHQKVKQLFLRYNTALSSSAPVERLFSSGSLILSKKRNRLRNKLFERLLMLKTTKQFRWRWSGITYYLHLKNSCLSPSCVLFMWTICGR